MEETVKSELEYGETCDGICYEELEFLEPEGFAIKDEGEVVFNGTPEQIAEMLDDYAKYFEEVENPENNASNPFFKSKYSPLSTVLNTIRPTLGKYGFGILQSPKIGANGSVQVQTILTHRSGATISFPSIESKPPKPDVQSVLSMITYLRRGSINAIMGICGEPDDDGNSNSPKKPTKPTPDKLTEEQQILRTNLIKLCADLTAKDSSNKSKIIESLKQLEPTGNVNKLKTEDDFNAAIKIVTDLGL